LLFDEREPFFRTLQDRVVFSKGPATSEPVDVVIRYSEVGPETIWGEILGTNRTHASIAPVFEDRSEFYCRIASAFPDWPARLSSSKVWLRSISQRGWREKMPPNEPVTIVGQFECEELLIDERHQDRDFDLPERTVTFYLSENARQWRSAGRTYEFRSFKLNAYPDTIDLATEYPFSIVAQPALIYDRYDRAPERIAAITTPTLTCTTTGTLDSYSTEQFVEETKAVVDDLLLLASLVSRCLIRWHRCSWFGLKGAETLVRPLGIHALGRDSRGTSPDETPVPLHRFAEFAGRGVPKLQSLKRQGLDLTLPIIYLVASDQSRIIEERFSYALLCLERLADHHGRSRDLSQIVHPKGFEVLRHALAAQIEAEFLSAESRMIPKPHRTPSEASALMQEKLAELNRPPFWTVLSALLEEYGVTWTDLYPPGLPRPSFISTRNKFIHSSDTLPLKLLAQETVRVQALCERLILRMLGWDDSHVPMGYVRRSLITP
jgi:hypothetical protein